MPTKSTFKRFHSCTNSSFQLYYIKTFVKSLIVHNNFYVHRALRHDSINGYKK